MIVVDLQPGYRIQQPLGDKATVLAKSLDPLYPELMCIIWAVEENKLNLISGTEYTEVYLTIDALSPIQEVGQFIGQASKDHLRALTQGRIWRPSTT